MAERVTHLRSIQGEQQRDTGWVRADEADVDAYVEGASPEVLACRQGRHPFPPDKPSTPLEFTAVDRDGLFIRRIRCPSCRLADRVEKWEGFRRGGRTRYRRVTVRLDYLTGPNGETYLAPPGQGRMTPRQVADSVATMAMQGQSLTALRKALPRVDG
jgi:hypothetical protein